MSTGSGEVQSTVINDLSMLVVIGGRRWAAVRGGFDSARLAIG